MAKNSDIEYTDELINKVMQLGMLGYDIDRIINVCDPEDEAQFVKDFNNEETVIYKSYKKGIDVAQYAIDIKLFDMAKEGDFKAIELLKQRKIERKAADKKRKKKKKKKIRLIN